MRKIVCTTIICFFALFGYSQTRPDQVILTYKAYNKPLKLVMKELANISKVNLVYSESRIPAEKLVNISASQESLGSVLSVLLDDYKLKYEIVGDQLVIVKIKDNTDGEFTIYGYVKDKISGELLIGANVFLHDKSSGTGTNESGFYSFKIKGSGQRIHYSYLGYKSEIKDFYVNKDTFVNIFLQPDGQLNEIVVLDDLLEEEKDNTASKQNLHIDKILSSNHLVGEADLFRFISIQPGVSTAADGIGGLNVRGGSQDQNLVLLDGVPIYNTGHALGIFSVFNSNTIKSASFYKGGIPARYSGRLSSVIDVYTKDGDYNKMHLDFTLSTIAAKATLQGPIIKGKGSYIVSFRRTFVDVWIKNLSSYINTENDKLGSANYYFNDFHAKINYNMTKKSKVILSAFRSNDQFLNSSTNRDLTELRDESQKQLDWKNEMYSAKLNTQLSKSFFSRFTLYKSKYTSNIFQNTLFQSVNTTMDTSLVFSASLFSTGIDELAIRQDFDWIPTSRHTLKFGVGYQRRKFTPKVFNANETDFPLITTKISKSDLENKVVPSVLNGDEANIYVEDDIDLGDGVRLNGGVSYSGIYTDNSRKYFAFQPRLAFLASGEKVHFKIGVSRMQQYMHLLTNTGLGLPTDVWLPTSTYLPPQKSWIFNTSVGYRTNSGYKFGVEVYYKTMEDIGSYKEGGGIDIYQGIDWKESIPIGKGTAYGFESYFEKVVGGTLFSLNYTYSISERTYPDLNVGRKFDFNFNRNHSFKVSFTHRLSPFSEFLMNYSLMTGNYYSKPENLVIPVNGVPTIVYLEKNNANFPLYHRLDLGFAFYNTHSWGKGKFFVGVYNAYARKNPFYADLVKTNAYSNKYEFRLFSLLPFLPTISYSLTL